MTSPRLTILTLIAGLSLTLPLPAQPLKTAPDRPVDISHLRLDLKLDLPGKGVEARAALPMLPEQR